MEAVADGAGGVAQEAISFASAEMRRSIGLVVAGAKEGEAGGGISEVNMGGGRMRLIVKAVGLCRQAVQEMRSPIRSDSVSQVAR